MSDIIKRVAKAIQAKCKERGYRECPEPLVHHVAGAAIEAMQVTPPICGLYRTIYLPDAGWVVFRAVGDLVSTDMVREHKQAVFVTENAALDYCQYRNRLVDLNGDDALGKVDA